jgi:hypothetical protein
MIPEGHDVGSDEIQDFDLGLAAGDGTTGTALKIITNVYQADIRRKLRAELMDVPGQRCRSSHAWRHFGLGVFLKWQILGVKVIEKQKSNFILTSRACEQYKLQQTDENEVTTPKFF